MEKSELNATGGTSEMNEGFEKFWEELTEWWGGDVCDDEEEMTLKKGKDEYKLRCAWNEDTLMVAMISPWAGEWDYVQMYRGMWGWGDVGEGFYSRTERKKAAELLLAEIIRRRTWLLENPDAAARKDGEVQAEWERKKADEQTANTPRWFEEYRWIRNQMAELGEGDMRLYVKGINRLFGVPIHCEWAIADQGE